MGHHKRDSKHYVAQQITWIHNLRFILFVSLLNSQLSQSSTEDIHLTIPALGRIADLGYIYDAVNDKIVELSIFKDNKFNKSLFVKTTQTPDYSLEFDVTTTFSDRFRLLNIDPNTAVNILLELITPEGSSSFLKNENENSPPGKLNGVLLYKYKTVVEDLRIFSEGAEELFDRSVLRNKKATHLVTSITWGANLAINLDLKTTSEDYPTCQRQRSKEKEHKYLLREQLEDVAKRISEDHNSTYELNTSASVYTDISPRTKSIWKFKSQMQIQQLLTEMPQILGETNGEKGVPIQIKLTPISFLRDRLRIQIENAQVLHPISNWILRGLIEIFDDVAASEINLKDIQKKLESHPDCVPLNSTIEFENIQHEFKKYVRNFKYDLHEGLDKVRSGESSKSLLTNLTQGYYANEFGFKKFSDKLKFFDKAIEKVEFCINLKSSFPSVEYFGKSKNVEDRLLQTISPVPIYTMFTKSQFIKAQPEQYRKISATFFHTLNKPYNKLFLIDCDFDHPHCIHLVNQTVIKELKNGEFTSRDIVADLKVSKFLEPIKRAAIGRFAQIGELYDARTETFLGISLLTTNRENENSSVTKTILNFNEATDIPFESYADKFKAFDVDPELQFSILAGLVQFKRDGQYFNWVKEQQQSFRLVRYSSVNKINVTDAIQQNALELNLLHDSQFLQLSGSATHFVSQITYGSSSVFSIKQKRDANVSSSVPEKSKRLLLDFVKSYAEERNLKNDTINEVWEVLKSDASELGVFSTISDNEELFGSIHNDNNNEKFLNYLAKLFLQELEQPIAYILFPIKNLREFGILKENVHYSNLFSTASGEALIQFQDILHALNRANDDVQHLRLQMTENSECITDKDMKDMKEVIQNFEKKSLDFKDQFKNIVVQIRMGAVQLKELPELSQNFLNQDYFGGDGRLKDMEKMSQVEEKLRMFNLVKKSQRIKYVGRKNGQVSVETIFMEASLHLLRIYILYYKPEWTSTKQTKWHRCTQIFFGPLSSRSGISSTEVKLYVINCEFNHLYCNNLTEPTIHEYRDGKSVSENYIESIEVEQAQIEKRFREINATMEKNFESLTSELFNLREHATENRKKIHKLESGLGNLTDVAAKNSDTSQQLILEQNKTNVAAKENKYFIGVLNSTKANLNQMVLLHKQDETRNNNVIKIEADIVKIKTQQYETVLGVNENKRLISALNLTKAKHMELESLSSDLRHVSKHTEENQKKIQNLKTGLDNLTDMATKNRDTIQLLPEIIKKPCVLLEKVKNLSSITNDVRNLTCGGLVNVPINGSMILKYKPVANLLVEQRCLWTLHSTHNDAWYGNKLKISLLCGTFGNSNDTLTYHEWSAHDAGNVSFYDLRSNTGQFLSTTSKRHRHFLYFNSKLVLPKVEFIVQVVVVESSKWETELNWFYDAVPGRVDYDQFKKARSTSISVVPLKTRPIQFIVEHVDSYKGSNGVCSNYGSLNVYELGERGIPRRLAQLCGVIRNPISYSTEFPVFAVFQTNHESIGTFKVSWK